LRPIKQLQMMGFEGDNWELLGDITSGSGEEVRRSAAMADWKSQTTRHTRHLVRPGLVSPNHIKALLMSARDGKAAHTP